MPDLSSLSYPEVKKLVFPLSLSPPSLIICQEDHHIGFRSSEQFDSPSSTIQKSFSKPFIKQESYTEKGVTKMCPHESIILI